MACPRGGSDGGTEGGQTQLQPECEGTVMMGYCLVQGVSIIHAPVVSCALVSVGLCLSVCVSVCLMLTSLSVQSLRVELQQAENLSEQLRTEHSAWMRQAHRRQEELEEANAELTRSLTSKEREVSGRDTIDMCLLCVY